MELRPNSSNDAALNVHAHNSKADQAKRWRENTKKSDPDFLKRERLRKQIYRMKRTPEEKRADNAKQKVRAARYREKKRKEGVDLNSNRKRLCSTRSGKEELRQYNRLKKQQSRARATAQKKRRVKEYDQTRRTLKRCHTPNSSEEDDEEEIMTPGAKKKRIQRIKKQLPKDSSKAADVLLGLIGSLTPRKREILEEECYVSPKKKKLMNCMFESVSNDKNDSRPLLKSLSRRNIDLKHAGSNLGVRFKFLEKLSQLEPSPRIGAVSHTVEEIVKDFYINPSIATCLPNKKYVRKGRPRYVLNNTVDEAHKAFAKKYPEIANVKLSKFNKMRPTNVRTFKSHKWVQCLCPKCINTSFKLKVVCNNDNKFEGVNKTLCKKEEGQKYPKLKCINRDCSSCGVDLILKGSFTSEMDQFITWKKWGNVLREKSNENEKKKFDWQLSTITGTRQELITEFKQEMQTMPMHLLVAGWQQDQFSYLKENLPDDTVLEVTDFAENYRNVIQDEPSQAHFNYTQTSIHPIVTYYKYGEKSIQEDIIIMSDDMKHDASAVDKFCNVAHTHLKEVRGLKWKKLVRYSDTCPSQYRGKNSFSFLKNNGPNTCYTYFGAHHGKGPADGACAVVKSALTNAVKCRKVSYLPDPQAAFQYAQTHLSVDREFYKRTFFFVSKEDVDHRPEHSNDAIQGSNFIQSMKNENGVILVRKLACFCKGCLNTNGSNSTCENKDYVEDWKTVAEFEKEQKQEKSKNRKEFKNAQATVSKSDSSSKKAKKKSKNKAVISTPHNSPMATRESNDVSPATVLKSVGSSKKAKKKSKNKAVISTPHNSPMATRESNDVSPRNARITRQSSKRIQGNGRNRYASDEILDVSSKNARTTRQSSKQIAADGRNRYSCVTRKSKQTQRNTSDEIFEVHSKNANAVSREETQRNRKRMRNVVRELIPEETIKAPPNYPFYKDLEETLLEGTNLCIDSAKTDGNCFFRCVSKTIYNTEEKHECVREIVTKFMQEKPHIFENFIDANIHFIDHTMYMSNLNVWATELEILATATLLSRPIFVYTPKVAGEEDYRWLKIDPLPVASSVKDFQNCTCHVSIINAMGNHYDRLVRIDGKCNCYVQPPVLETQESHVDLTETCEQVSYEDFIMDADVIGVKRVCKDNEETARPMADDGTPKSSVHMEDKMVESPGKKQNCILIVNDNKEINVDLDKNDDHSSVNDDNKDLNADLDNDNHSSVCVDNKDLGFDLDKNNDQSGDNDSKVTNEDDFSDHSDMSYDGDNLCDEVHHNAKHFSSVSHDCSRYNSEYLRFINSVVHDKGTNVDPDKNDNHSSVYDDKELNVDLNMNVDHVVFKDDQDDFSDTSYDLDKNDDHSSINDDNKDLNADLENDNHSSVCVDDKDLGFDLDKNNDQSGDNDSKVTNEDDFSDHSDHSDMSYDGDNLCDEVHHNANHFSSVSHDCNRYNSEYLIKSNTNEAENNLFIYGLYKIPQVGDDPDNIDDDRSVDNPEYMKDDSRTVDDNVGDDIDDDLLVDNPKDMRDDSQTVSQMVDDNVRDDIDDDLIVNNPDNINDDSRLVDNNVSDDIDDDVNVHNPDNMKDVSQTVDNNVRDDIDVDRSVNNPDMKDVRQNVDDNVSDDIDDDLSVNTPNMKNVRQTVDNNVSDDIDVDLGVNSPDIMKDDSQTVDNNVSDDIDDDLSINNSDNMKDDSQTVDNNVSDDIDDDLSVNNPDMKDDSQAVSQTVDNNVSDDIDFDLGVKSPDNMKDDSLTVSQTVDNNVSDDIDVDLSVNNPDMKDDSQTVSQMVDNNVSDDIDDDLSINNPDNMKDDSQTVDNNVSDDIDDDLSVNNPDMKDDSQAVSQTVDNNVSDDIDFDLGVKSPDNMKDDSLTVSQTVDNNVSDDIDVDLSVNNPDMKDDSQTVSQMVDNNVSDDIDDDLSVNNPVMKDDSQTVSQTVDNNVSDDIDVDLSVNNPDNMKDDSQTVDDNISDDDSQTVDDLTVRNLEDMKDDSQTVDDNVSDNCDVIDDLQIQIGDYALINVPTMRGSVKPFPAEILDYDHKEKMLRVSFLQYVTNKTGVFAWPAVEDVKWTPRNSLVKKLTFPEIDISSRRCTLSFKEIDN